MIFYVSHKCDSPSDIDRARKITQELQMNDLQNSYFCPVLALSHIPHGKISEACELAIRGDFLQMCDKLIVASEQDDLVKSEIALAQTLKNSSQEPIEVMYIEDEYGTV